MHRRNRGSVFVAVYATAGFSCAWLLSDRHTSAFADGLIDDHVRERRSKALTKRRGACCRFAFVEAEKHNMLADDDMSIAQLAADTRGLAR